MAYVYRHIRLDKNEPFYIGIGSDNKYSRAKQKTGRNDRWHNKGKKGLYSHTEESKLKMSLSRKGNKQSKEHIDKRLKSKKIT